MRYLFPRSWTALACCLALAAGCRAGSPPALPPQDGAVNDLAGLLPREAVSSLDEQLAEYERETCHRFVVLIVPSLHGESIAELSARAMDSWQVGRGPLGSGLLLTLSVEEGSARMDAGPALEQIVRSGLADTVLRQVMFPHFAEGRYEEGLRLGLGRIMEEGRGISFPEELHPPVCR